MKKTIELELGALAPKIKTQMKKQKIVIDQKYLDQFQRDADAIVRLHWRGLLNDSETDRARHRLFAKVKKAVRL